MSALNRPLDALMKAVVTLGPGGLDRLSYRDVPIPRPGAGEVLIAVRAAGLNNTDVNTRVGWYGAPASPDSAAPAAAPSSGLAGWNGATPFPLIQGVDCCGHIVDVGAGVAPGRRGERVLVRPCMRVAGFARPDTRWLGVDFNGSFAQYVVVPAAEAFAINSPWTDVELATLPCAYGTAEAMLQRAAVTAGETVLVPGASGGVASAVVQLARQRGARVIALTKPDKAAAVAALGANRVATAFDDLTATPEAGDIDVVVDNVGGAGFPALLKLLRRGGRYVTSGAIAGASVPLDLRELYLKDLTLIGSTAWDAAVFPGLITAVESGTLRPLVAATYPLAEMVAAQAAFLEKRHVGKIVLVPPPAG
jgi:NADPH:quinone reductase-like Zn-dependent oxidoreductase